MPAHPPAVPAIPHDLLPAWLLHARWFQVVILVVVGWPTLTAVLTSAWRLTPPAARRTLEKSPARAWFLRAIRKSGLDVIPAALAFARALLAVLGVPVPAVPGSPGEVGNEDRPIGSGPARDLPTTGSGPSVPPPLPPAKDGGSEGDIPPAVR